MLAFFLFALNFLVCLLLFHNFYFKRRKLPPGPAPLPFVGNLLNIRKEMPEQCFLRWRRQYGDVFTFWLGEVPMICVTDYAKIMETFQKDGETYAGRQPFVEMEKLLRGGSNGVILVDGEKWREQRRFILQIFRDFGLGKNLMQQKILSEFELMFERIEEEIKQANGENVNIAEHFDVNVGSIINNFLFGYRFNNERLGEFREIKRLLGEMIDSSFDPLLVIYQWNPFLSRLPFVNKIFVETAYRKHKKFGDFHERQIKERSNKIDFNERDSEPKDFVEAFLREKARRDAIGETHGFTIDQLKGMCVDLWMAGQETSSTTLAWGVAFLINYDEVQAKVHEELDQIVGGTERIVTTADRPSLPYTNATINEIQRLANLVPLNIPHRVIRDVCIDGYNIPKDSIVIPQISAVLADEKIFERPLEFRPERFLDEEGKPKRIDELIPFSVGKRQCLGESLARMELFLFLANLLNKYKFLAGSNGPPSLKRQLGGTARCPQYVCKIKRRNAKN